jgi:hypothetical protein
MYLNFILHRNKQHKSQTHLRGIYLPLLKLKGGIIIERALLNLKEVCEYLNIGETNARKLLKSPKCNFSVRIGNRLYANKKQLDIWINMQN